MKDDKFESYFYEELSQIVTKLRDDSGRTFEDVALLLGIPPMTYYKYEKGSRKMPITIFKRLCILYNIDMSETLMKIYNITTKKIEADQKDKRWQINSEMRNI